MSAMPKIDLFAVYAAEVRGIQDRYPKAHEALKNWGAWSRSSTKDKPRVSCPAIWREAKQSEFDDYAEEGEQGEGIVDQVEVKAEPAQYESFNERFGEEIDVRIHRDIDFPPIWRRCLRAAYVERLLEHQFPREARVGPSGYLVFLDGSLAHLQKMLER